MRLAEAPGSRKTPWLFPCKTLLVLLNIVSELTAFLPMSSIPPVLCVQRIGETIFGEVSGAESLPSAP